MRTGLVVIHLFSKVSQLLVIRVNFHSSRSASGAEVLGFGTVNFPEGQSRGLCQRTSNRKIFAALGSSERASGTPCSIYLSEVDQAPVVLLVAVQVPTFSDQFPNGRQSIMCITNTDMTLCAIHVESVL
jgi:hypothetical protein